jgi:glycosyltransferase involved in cell wall biosynthesis
VTATAVSVTSWRGQPTAAELAARAARDEAPRTDYVELARGLDAVVVDGSYMSVHASPVARHAWSRLSHDRAQALELHLRRRRYGQVIAWNPGVGLSLALLSKLARSDQTLVLVLVEVSSLEAVALRRLGLHTQITAIVVDGGTPQVERLRSFGVPERKLHFFHQRVDERFWRCSDEPEPRLICAVGQGRDHQTLALAVAGSKLEVEVAAGSMVSTPAVEASVAAAAAISWPPNVRFRANVGYPELRRLYARSRFVVVPLHDVAFDAGATAITEAMAMGKAVIVSKIRGQVDIVRDGETGIYVRPDDPRALREAIDFLADNPVEAERMGGAGRALVEKRHALSGWVTSVSSLLRETEAG